MNPDKQELYRITWRQDYPEFQEAIDNAMDILLELTEYKEANEVIKMIKAKL
jgi:hypothetical protein